MNAPFWTACYLVCVPFAYGLTLGFFQRGWPELAYRNRWSDCGLALFAGALGPAGVLVALLHFAAARRKPTLAFRIAT